ncbi:hypothetical protein GJW-30_1_04311 [Variibacter gotjawalensis]|uniref:L,D-TPase catalytic domain-containing protein n=1 Tax=Variibacter gotjawalensis TaxID=1333996 RepID=A0A0S3Q0M5_9BRAD|nr:L,D-transpeptidase [Variibacter gotjawalensis]NIK47590.1 hypothetical protein [Variibacter gotjawalensis]RZS49487.1 L,D-transpeptidase-like protein [Variibacter gotjawalensis]BAT61750.1 hypothetical protein GJW-30_1_04311 [Variibacter gotjawalensis]
MFKRILAAAAVLAALSGSASASVLVSINKSTQRMTVSVDGTPRHSWAVSTGRAGFGTPNGQFRPQRLERSWFSRKYYNAPMPHAIFFHGGYAIHGTTELRRLGGPASHGCVRLHPGNAAALFALVRQRGMGNTRIVVTGANPRGGAVAARSAPRRAVMRAGAPDFEERGLYRPQRQPSGWFMDDDDDN